MICTVSDCNRKHVAKGYCTKHYWRFKTYGDPLVVKRRVGENRGDNPLYSVYRAVIQRCYSPQHAYYLAYGAKGIKLCDRWLGVDGFSNFIEDMGERPKGKTLDRIDNDGNYSPENCRWATLAAQQINRSRPKNNKSGTTGVFWWKVNKRWVAKIQAEGKIYHLGFFIDKQDAINARHKAELKYHKPILEGAIS